MNFLITGGRLHSARLLRTTVQEGHGAGLDLSTGDPQALSPDVHFTQRRQRRPKLDTAKWT
jgi:hypothetical protein